MFGKIVIKLKNAIFNGPLIIDQTFSQTEFIIGISYFANIMNFDKCLIFVKFENISHQKMVLVKFYKIFTGPLFCGGWAKNLQTFIRHFF